MCEGGRFSRCPIACPTGTSTPWPASSLNRTHGADVPTLPLIAPSSNFAVMKLHLEVMAAASRKDVATAKAKAAEMAELASALGQHPFVQRILTIQAREAAASAAHSHCQGSVLTPD